MKRLLFILYTVLLSVSAMVARTGDGVITSRDVTLSTSGDYLVVNMNLMLDQLTLKRNHQVFVTPFIENPQSKESIMLPTYVFSGRNMHYVYLRNGNTKASGKTKYNIVREMYARKRQTEPVGYTQRVPLERWMLDDDAELRLSFDTCGCGRAIGESSLRQPLELNPLNRLLVVPFPRPVPEVPKITYHHGKARVEFEVDKFELHEEVYTYTHKVTKRRHVIDNRGELKVIDDSIHYALSDPNVEIDLIKLCGYASPESPYLHNDYLATNRSRALAEYIAKRYSLPQERCTFDAVPENWAGFREQVLTATTITEQQRQDLLSLIDRPAYGPTDYDDKETELITGKKFARLYTEQIHPDWFPKLRYTDFVIQTRLKSMTTEQLHEVLAKTPELLSLNQIYTVAADCEHGSDEFKRAMAAALEFYPEDQTANCNAAAMAVEQKDYALAEKYLQKAGDTDEANVLRGIVEVSKLNFDQAREFFRKAKNCPEAQRNLQLMK